MTVGPSAEENGDVMDDQQLERVAPRLGVKAEQGLDVEHVAERVVQRLRTEETKPSKAPQRWFGLPGGRRVVQLAAALAVLFTGGLLVRNMGPTTDVSSAEFAVPLALDDLSESELTDVLDSLEIAGPVQQIGRAGIDDLSDAELEELLAMMES